MNSAKECKIVATEDDCPLTMEIDNKKNYLGSSYVSNPITAAPTSPVDPEYGADFTDFREDNYDLAARACPISFD